MTMPAAHQNFITNNKANAQRLLDFFGEEEQLNILWAGSPNYQNTLTQEEINDVVSFAGAGLTTQNIADGQFAMATINGIIQNALVALTVLANLP